MTRIIVREGGGHRRARRAGIALLICSRLLFMMDYTDALSAPKPVPEAEKTNAGARKCYHCGTVCITRRITRDGHFFCCEGCLLVYELLSEKNLCDYYTLEKHPGLSRIKPLRSDKYAYLDEEAIAEPLYQFRNGSYGIVTFYIPGIHCSSCMWLLEHLYRLHPAIIESRLNFSAKEVTIRFREGEITLRRIVELLATIGYEPYISLAGDEKRKNARSLSSGLVYRVGVAGFCFGNIMLMSFPEYLSGGAGLENSHALLFRYLNLLLSVPVFFYCASVFFRSAWAGIKQKMLNIDAPIALALLITYTRSLYEIFTGMGNGYLDSMSGIVFFMLIGRIVQERTYRSLSFHRDYKSYFPVAVTVLTDKGEEARKLEDLRGGDRIRIHPEEVVPADGRLVAGAAKIDYSFVTGESEPVAISEGGFLYAGGKQTGEAGTVVLELTKPVAGSYLTSLWNHHAFRKSKSEKNDRDSFVHVISKYFTYILLLLAALTAIYWGIYDPSKIIPSVSAMLIVACPCALLLAATYTHGNLIRIFSMNGLYLRDAAVIEQLGNISHIAFDKTGTLTHGGGHLTVTGHILSEPEKDCLYAVVSQSKHPYSVLLADWLGMRKAPPVSSWKLQSGSGIEAAVSGLSVKVGSPAFTEAPQYTDANVVVRIGDNFTGFHTRPDIREAARTILPVLREKYGLSLLSGDHQRNQPALRELFGASCTFLLEQKPLDKLDYIASLQKRGDKVMMVGDGLNDAGALQQSDVGMTLTEDVNNFTPSCDAILDSGRLGKLPEMLELAAWGRKIIHLSFAFSVLYNIVGLYISVQAKMNPMIAAILMPASTLTIVLITTGASTLAAGRLGLFFRKTVGAGRQKYDDNHVPA